MARKFKNALLDYISYLIKFLSKWFTQNSFYATGLSKMFYTSYRTRSKVSKYKKNN